MDNQHDLMVKTDREGTLLFVNPAYCTMFGKNERELLGMNYSPLVHPDDLPLVEQAVARLFSPPFSCSYEERAQTAFGWRWLEWTAKSVMDDKGSVCALIGAGRDITERKRAEEEIRKQLAEKETLLKEGQHRMKNNLAMVSSLLGLSADGAVSEEARRAILEARGRVESMEKLYERLLQTEDYGGLSARAYLEELIAAVMALAPGKERPEVALEAEDLELEARRLFPLGLAVNELLTNALKYAFADGKAGRVGVTLSRRGTTATLTVRDNGRGLPAGFDPARSKGFGLTLVGMLAEQLGGTFTMRAAGEADGGPGTLCVLEFKTGGGT